MIDKKWIKAGFGAMGLLAATAATVFYWSTGWGASLGGDPDGERLERIRQSKQWSDEDGIFVNSVPTTVMMPGKTWEVTLDWFDKPGDAVPDTPPSTVRPVFSEPPADGLRVTWLGHSTTLVEIDGARILIDSVFADRASPSTLVGPLRFHPLPVDPSELPELDAIIISHDHYDHLDMRAARELAASSNAPFLVPLGVGEHLEVWDIPADRIREFDWWDETQIGPVTIAATPSRHFSGRGLLNRFSTLWASWTFVGPEHRVFFSGDTGLFDGFADIADKYGPFDIAMYEIGAFNTNWGQIHLGPEGALDAFEMMDAKLVVPIHWGTFDLGLHGWKDPIRTFATLADERGHRWAAPMPGGAIEPGVSEPKEPWWE
ncbi:hypothetical protein FIV42_13830 [Persicimonas caeni]|uniref:Metallo-beta-lactamase domain-containing protein n=1 Tax=Persicimonas caeni TaxID=2292766 RepID=A0A4Y6PTX3_PERCE|nr:MBL fold metallo-hydrolase [Persicimonas caeni]QDG51786.1 hypothetical protein FIV42_13830 [Persicimonas caeni]QED33007.1 hypothetical protein FRD00_13825 [Persicimonas caeni]